MADTDPPWLTDDEDRLWRGWLRLSAVLPAVLHHELQQDADLSLPDFDVLVQLTDRPDSRLRIVDLARSLTWERSRVSHHVSRMERRGLVEREDCADDGRGMYVVLTDKGRRAIEAAAPGHVRTVRAAVLDGMTAQEAKVVGRFVDRVLSRIDPQAASEGPPATE